MGGDGEEQALPRSCGGKNRGFFGSVDGAVSEGRRVESHRVDVGGGVQEEEAGRSGALCVFVSEEGESDYDWIAVQVGIGREKGLNVVSIVRAMNWTNFWRD